METQLDMLAGAESETLRSWGQRERIMPRILGKLVFLKESDLLPPGDILIFVNIKQKIRREFTYVDPGPHLNSYSYL